MTIQAPYSLILFFYNKRLNELHFTIHAYPTFGYVNNNHRFKEMPIYNRKNRFLPTTTSSLKKQLQILPLKYLTLHLIDHP